MDIKIGFTGNVRDVTVTTSGNQDEVLAQVDRALKGDDPVLTLHDDKGAVVVAKSESIAWVEVGSSAAPRVGFIATAE